jgi:hypothetical protein
VAVRNARQEALERIGGGHDVRVLEPSPPAINEPPFFADDPLEGGEVLPIERAGATTWEEIATSDDDLRTWCAERWLVSATLPQLPDGFVASRRALHALAERVIAPARFNANGKIGLRYTYQGFGTPFFGEDHQIRVERGALVVDDAHHPITTLGAAAALVGVDLEAGTGVYTPTTDSRPDVPLDVSAGLHVGSWFGYCTRLLEQLRTDATADDAPARVQVWPEHFDIAVDLGPDGGRANFGGSPGDDAHPEPYLYVGPWGDHGDDAYWNEPFGASLSYAHLLAGADGLAFLRRGKELL